MLRRFESWPDWKIAATLTLVLRIFYTTVGAGFSIFLTPDPGAIRSNALAETVPVPSSPYYAVLGIWQRFDTLWYVRIAERGYDSPFAVIFYPLYPATIRLLSWFSPTLVSALLISSVAAFFYFWGMLRLAASDISESGRFRMLILISVWPTSFVLFAAYAESLTMALVVWAVVFARSDRWWAASACGFLAGVCRPSGVLVLVPLAVLAIRKLSDSSWSVCFVPLGTLAYWGWLHWSGRPSVVDAYRIYQHSTLAPPWASFVELMHIINFHENFMYAVELGLVVLALLFSLRRQVRIEDRLFVWAVVVQMMMHTGRPLLGASRYLLIAYPVFVSLGSYAAEPGTVKQFTFYSVVFGLFNLVWLWAFLKWSLVL